jgi:hypothetical protein
MQPAPISEAPRWVLQALNNLYDIERKLAGHGDPGNIKRNVERIKDALKDMNQDASKDDHEQLQFFYEDPMGQAFNETRTDLDASITGVGTENLVVVEVIKPIVRFGNSAFSRVIQKGIVVVQSKTEEES